MTSPTRRDPGQSTPRASDSSFAAYAHGTQIRRVAEALNGRWICGGEFVSGEFDAGKTWEPNAGTPVLRYSAIIHRLRRDGWWASRRLCCHPRHHHRAPMWQWTIEQQPAGDGELFGRGLA